MLKRVVDLTSCDTEPIHIIGAVQPHGALAAADASSLRVDYASLNLEAFTGVSAHDLLGQPLERLLGAANVADLLARDIAPLGPETHQAVAAGVDGHRWPATRGNAFPTVMTGGSYSNSFRSRTGPARVWEQDLIRQRIISELVKPDTLEELAQVSADIIREVTGFDRVMIYRFAHDLHGEVIAESTVRPDSFPRPALSRLRYSRSGAAALPAQRHPLDPRHQCDALADRDPFRRGRGRAARSSA